MTDPGSAFRALHQRGAAFILANCWDAGSARMLQAMGAQAVATSSAAHAFTLGRPDGGTLTRDEALTHAQDIVAAVHVPVQGDFENGFGDDPDTCAQTVRLAAEVGLAGICIEDTALPGTAPYDRALAIERIRAAASAARALPRDFVLTARADGLMLETYDLTEAIARLQAFQTAGADCLYAPIPASFEDLTRLCTEVTGPVNALVAGRYTAFDRVAYQQIGVARLSLGSALARVTHRAIHDAAAEMFGAGTFKSLGNGISSSIVDALLTKD